MDDVMEARPSEQLFSALTTRSYFLLFAVLLSTLSTISTNGPEPCPRDKKFIRDAWNFTGHDGGDARHDISIFVPFWLPEAPLRHHAVASTSHQYDAYRKTSADRF